MEHSITIKVNQSAGIVGKLESQKEKYHNTRVKQTKSSISITPLDQTVLILPDRCKEYHHLSTMGPVIGYRQPYCTNRVISNLGQIIIESELGMARKCHNHILQTNQWCLKKETQNTNSHITVRRQPALFSSSR